MLKLFIFLYLCAFAINMLFGTYIALNKQVIDSL
jgi:hypothetical protein